MVIVSDEISSYLNSLVVKYEEDPQKQLFDNVVLPPQTFRHYPLVYLWSPLKRFNVKVICPVHGLFLKNGTWTISNKKNCPRNPRLVYGRTDNILLVQQLYLCPKNHSYRATCEFIMNHPSLKNFELYFPFQKYHRSMYTHDLIQYIFMEIVHGVSFHSIAESVASYHFSRYQDVLKGGMFQDFKNSTLHAYPSVDGIESTFIDIFKKHESFFKAKLNEPFVSISLDHTFKVGKSIGGFRETDNKFVKECFKLLVVMNERGLIVEWKLTKTTSQDEIEPLLVNLKNRGSGTKVAYIFTDTCCHAKRVYEEIFPNAEIKLDLFHACQRITKTLPDKKSNSAVSFSQNFGLIFRKEGDFGECRNLETENEKNILENLEKFLLNHADYINNLPDHKKKALEAEIENLKLHIQKGCCSRLPPGGGTENNERLHRYLNRSYLRGASVLGMELAEAVLSVLFFVYNSRIKLNIKGDKICPFEFPLLNQGHLNFIEEDENRNLESGMKERTHASEDNEVLLAASSNIIKIFNSLAIIEKQCIKRGFKVESILGFSESTISNPSSDQLKRNLLYFNLKVDKVQRDGDCLFRSILIQLSKLDLNSGLFNNLKQHLENLEISLQVINEDISKLR